MANLEPATVTASKVIRDWPPGIEFSAKEAFKRHPHLGTYQMARVEIIYEEFCQLTERGEAPCEADYIASYPDLSFDLRRLFEFHRSLDDLTGSRWPREGQSVDRYRLEQCIGTGGFSRVFLAIDTKLGERRCVVKVTSRSGDEPSLLGRLSHPGIVSVENVVDLEGDLVALVMGYREAVSLDRIFGATSSFDSGSGDAIIEVDDALSQNGFRRDEPCKAACSLPRTNKLLRSIVIQIADALAFAHSSGVTHGDLKPSNVLLGPDGSTSLIDFNLSVSGTNLGLGGTCGYLAPEQSSAVSQGQPPPASGSTDVYAFGVLASEILAGCRWGDGADSFQAGSQKPASFLLEQIRRRHGTDWRELIARCVALSPDDRPVDAAAVFQDLSRIEATSKRRSTLKRIIAAGAAAAAVPASVAFLVYRSPAERIDRAIASTAAGEWTAALDWIGSLEHAELGPKFSLFKSMLCLTTGRYNEALAAVRFAESTRSTPLTTETFGTALAASREDLEAASRRLNLCKSGVSDPERVFNNLGYVLTRLGRFDKALQALARAHSFASDNITVALNQAILEIRMARHEQRQVSTAVFEVLESVATNSPERARFVQNLNSVATRGNAVASSLQEPRLTRSALYNAVKQIAELRASDRVASFPNLQTQLILEAELSLLLPRPEEALAEPTPPHLVHNDPIGIVPQMHDRELARLSRDETGKLFGRYFSQVSK